MNIETIKRRLLVKYPFFGSIVANSNFVSEPTIKTAATDGETIYYNPNFLEAVDFDQKIFIFAHEICHIAFNHILRCEDKDKRIWNIATDSVINAFLKQDGLPIVEGGIDIKEAINYDAEEMYEKLLENEKANKYDNNQVSKNQNENCDVGHDTHSMWNKKLESEETKKFTGLGEKEVFKQNKIERKKQLEELRKELVSQSHGYGSDISSALRNITDIGTANQLIDWRRLLKEAIKYDVDWSYQNAEIEDGIVRAHLESMPRPDTEILLDTSGSIDETLLRNFLRECKNILPISKVKVGCFDTKFYGFTEINDVSDIDKLVFPGGGGTNFEVLVNAFTKRVENKIIFTDGDALMPKSPINAIWIVFGGRKIKPVGGKVIYIDNNQLKKLDNYEITSEVRGKTR